MKAIDLHIHTIPTASDSYFEFSIDGLKKYVDNMKLDIIAITNHNIFDKEQYLMICKEINASVLPGIEINFEGGHLLLISDNKNIEDFEYKCSMVNSKICDPKLQITQQELKEIFIDLNRYLLIPHYPKKPKVPLPIIRQLSKYISAIEVSSVKDFIREYKENSEFVPVWFSDIRASNDSDNFKCGRVYLNIEGCDISSIKSALIDREKVKLSREESIKLFPLDNKDFQISTGLNVVLGERSSGKTHLLDYISESNQNTKYLKQFSLLDKKLGDSKEFYTQINNRYSNKAEEYLEKFKSVINEVLDINLIAIENDIDEYIKSIVKFANEQNRRDSFSKAKIFTEVNFEIKNLDSLDKIISGIEILIKNEEYKDILAKYIDIKALKMLVVELAKKYIEIQRVNKIKDIANKIIKETKERLQFKSTSTNIKNIDLKKYLIAKDKIKKFDHICLELQKGKKFEIDTIGKFRLMMRIEKHKNATSIKNQLKTNEAFSNAFKKYQSGFEYLQELKGLNIQNIDYYKCYCNISFDVFNEFDLSASGGERAEYNLLNEIRLALDYDMLLIDEPESSFDNLFLKKEVNTLIKDISKKMPVIIVTHNNTVALTIRPDYLLYTVRTIIYGKPEFKIYKGYPDSEFLECNLDKISTKTILMNSLEAGEDAYNIRRKYYDLHENRK